MDKDTDIDIDTDTKSGQEHGHGHFSGAPLRWCHKVSVTLYMEMVLQSLYFFAPNKWYEYYHLQDHLVKLQDRQFIFDISMNR